MSDILLCGILNKDKGLNPVDALLLALIGIAIVFALLIVLMLIIMLVGKIFDGSEKLKANHPEYADKISKLKFWEKKKPAQETSAPVVNEPEEKEYADGSCGELKLINVEDKDAAMIMAIVADELKVPLNELRFKSIKYIGEEEK